MFAVFFLILFVGAFIITLSLVPKGEYKANRVRYQDENLENLNRMQSYEFWRDFGERGEQEKT